MIFSKPVSMNNAILKLSHLERFDVLKNRLCIDTDGRQIQKYIYIDR